ncbi:surface antigen-like protein [Leptomonas pyrrhocoris]|uniref:Surface antigen-like protein n=1 Tax=Leptomonas pyrrhocoris TaxID=157538 RepID=A0A0M9FZ50_LEPPY|nr:surface antigen-like protein [Leptomonas pyrrhocoris]KPA78897.1 surface antigen-like protein [Leptomonas pyrrhocoris]|eukprot:XP_015657336.1 surface antigen-like protein [Leptomonas pyrrhocoris]
MSVKWRCLLELAEWFSPFSLSSFSPAICTSDHIAFGDLSFRPHSFSFLLRLSVSFRQRLPNPPPNLSSSLPLLCLPSTSSSLLNMHRSSLLGVGVAVLLFLLCVRTTSAADAVTENSASTVASAPSSASAAACTVAGCVRCVPGSTTTCAACATDVSLVDGQCVYEAACTVADCSMCDVVNISRCATCMAGHRINPDYTCSASGDRAGGPCSSAVALLVSVLALAWTAPLTAM